MSDEVLKPIGHIVMNPATGTWKYQKLSELAAPHGSPALPKTKEEWQRGLASGCALELAGVEKDFATVRDTVLRYLKISEQCPYATPVR